MKVKILSGSEKLKYSLKSLRNHTALNISIFLAVILSLIYIIFNRSIFQFNSPNFFADFIDPIINIFTFLTALLIGFYNLYSNWKNSLEKRLTVFYVYYYDNLSEIEKTFEELKKPEEKKKKEMELEFIKQYELSEKVSYCVMICDEALLAHEGDIRNWGQQLGRQFTKGNLDFHPFFTLGYNKDIVKVTIGENVKFTKQYLLYVFLESLPQHIINLGSGLLSTENYDDSPTSKIKYFKIREIDHKKIMSFQESKKFIEEMHYITSSENQSEEL